MSWLSDLKYSNRLEHLYAMIAGDEELDETVPSTYDRKQGFLFKIAQKIAELSEGGGGSGGGAVYATFTESDGTWSCDKTFAELKAAWDAGQTILGRCAYSAGRFSGIAMTPMAYFPGDSENDEPDVMTGRWSVICPSPGSATFISCVVQIASIPNQDDEVSVTQGTGQLALAAQNSGGAA